MRVEGGEREVGGERMVGREGEWKEVVERGVRGKRG